MRGHQSFLVGSCTVGHRVSQTLRTRVEILRARVYFDLEFGKGDICSNLLIWVIFKGLYRGELLEFEQGACHIWIREFQEDFHHVRRCWFQRAKAIHSYFRDVEDHQVINDQLFFSLRVQIWLDQLLLAFLAPALPLRQELDSYRLQLRNSAWLPHEISKSLGERGHLVDVELLRERLVERKERIILFFGLLTFRLLLLFSGFRIG